MQFSIKKLILSIIWGISSFIYSFLQVLSLAFSCKVNCPQSYLASLDRASFLELISLLTIGLPGLISTNILTLLKEYMSFFETPITQGNFLPIIVGSLVSILVSYVMISLLLTIFKGFTKTSASKK